MQGFKLDICSSVVGPAASLHNRSQLIYLVSSIPSSFMRRTNSWRKSGNPSAVFRMDEEVMLGEDKRLPDLTYKDISILWLINCFGGGVTDEFPCRGERRGHVTARSHMAQRKALSEFECYPSQSYPGHEMRAAFLCLQEKCHQIFSIPSWTVAPVWLKAALLTQPL